MRTGSHHRCRLRARATGRVLVVLAVLAGACGPGQKRGASWLGDTHAASGRTPAEAGTAAPAASPAELTSALERALAEGRDADAIVLASTLARAGGSVDARTWVAVHAAPVHVVSMTVGAPV